MKFYYDEDSTPVNQDEICNLIPTHIQKQSELNLWEQNNITNAEIGFYNKSSFRGESKPDFYI
jgi:hypothetical protein